MMIAKKINAAPVINLQNKNTVTFEDIIKKIPLKDVSEIDFVTCGIEPKGELFLRASKLLLSAEKSKVESSRRKNSLSEVAFRLVQGYVRRRNYFFKSDGVNIEDCLTKKRVWKLMTLENMLDYLRDALEFRGQIENAANDSEMYAIALEIIHEYETFCSHRVAIDKYRKAQRKIIKSYDKVFRFLLEKRDGLLCQGCKLVESVERFDIDHIKPLSLGGKSEIENLQLLCRSCNSKKGNR